MALRSFTVFAFVIAGMASIPTHFFSYTWFLAIRVVERFAFNEAVGEIAILFGLNIPSFMRRIEVIYVQANLLL